MGRPEGLCPLMTHDDSAPAERDPRSPVGPQPRSHVCPGGRRCVCLCVKRQHFALINVSMLH